jgi:hypothetical protein
MGTGIRESRSRPTAQPLMRLRYFVAQSTLQRDHLSAIVGGPQRGTIFVSYRGKHNMKIITAFGGMVTTILAALALAACQWQSEKSVDTTTAASLAMDPPAEETHQGLLYGRVRTDDGDIYEGRLRFGGDEEALWGNYFNGFKDENTWVAHVPRDRMPGQLDSLVIFRLTIKRWMREGNLGRPFMARFGDIARIEALRRKLRVTLKSGTTFQLNRYAADDLADGVRVWDDRQGVVDLDEGKIHSIELLAAPRTSAAPNALYGTVQTREDDFTGFVQWDRKECLASDELNGSTAEGEISLRFDSIRSIARRSRDSSVVTLLDGRDVVLTAGREVSLADRGIYVDDQRYGRVLISWDAFERVDFGSSGTGPAYGDFPLGRSLRGSVVERSGRRVTGRLVYDLDESEITETLDAPSQGVDYTIPFGLIASIVLTSPEQRGAQRVRVALHSGEELQLERSGDLSGGNGGMLIFLDGGRRPEYVPWGDVERVDFELPPKMYPPIGPR